MTTLEAFSRLGIPTTKDLSEINQAYRKLAVLHHPEEDPEGFMGLHQAYKTARAYALETSGKEAAPSEPFPEPEEKLPAREELTYESLFSGIEEKPEEDIASQKRAFSRKLLGLKLHWLPIGLKSWQRLFGSEEYLLCRKSPECMEELLDLLKRKIHTYAVLRFLLMQLWELHSWQKSEGMEAQATKTHLCIRILNKQYSHYLKGASQPKVIRLLKRPLLYYQAVPFYFKMLTSAFVLPLLPGSSDDLKVGLLLCFYFLELCTCARKTRRELGIFHPKMQKGKPTGYMIKTGDNPLVQIATIFAIMLHIALCVGN